MTGRAPKKRPAVRGLAGAKAEKTVSLALQGGGAHGAFTWGVLDALIEDGRLAFEAVSGASAGAMNAVVMAEGWLEGGPEGARHQLEVFWRRVSLDGALSPAQRTAFDAFLGFWSGSDAWNDFWGRTVSPYDSNPLNLNPVRDALESLIDFERVRAAEEIAIFVAATHVWSGKIAVFPRSELTAAHLMASACLPTVFQSVEIAGEPYWDGGYMGNPPLFPLFYQIPGDDVLLVQINPVERRSTPRSAREIHNRLNEITFNASLLRELRAVEFVTRLVDSGKLSAAEYKRVLMHRIDGSGALDDYTASSRSNAEWGFFVTLRDAGRRSGAAWLARHYDSLGQRSTIDLKETFA